MKNETIWGNNELGNLNKVAANWYVARKAFNLYQQNPRPATSYDDEDAVSQLELYTDEGCSVEAPMTEAVNPFHLLMTLNNAAKEYNR